MAESSSTGGSVEDPSHRRAGELNSVSLELFDDCRSLAPKSGEVAGAKLRDLDGVARPGANSFFKRVELVSPAFVVFVDIRRADNEKVNVALGVAVAARRRPEQTRVKWSNLPSGDQLSKLLEEARAEIGKHSSDGSRDVIVVQLEQAERADVPPADDPLPDKAVEGQAEPAV